MISFPGSKRTFLPYTFIFTGFLFFNTIFNGSTKTNNLLHLAILFFIFHVIVNKKAVYDLRTNPVLIRGLLLVAAFLFYFTLSNLWSADPGNITATLTHSIYILFYITMTAMVLSSPDRKTILGLIILGFSVVFTWLLISNFQVILHRGPVTNHNPTAENVIDLSGLACIALILSISLYQETKNKLLFPCMVLFIFFILLTQSRGPFLSLIIAYVIGKGLPGLTRKNIAISLAIIILSVIFIETTELGTLIRLRAEEAYTQSFLRFSIWKHSLELFSGHYLIGNGFSYQLHFINYSGEHIHTTHSLYIGTLLKGGIIGGGLLLSLLIYSLNIALKTLKQGYHCGAILMIFSMLFYTTQGMFVIGNPQEFWYLFWFPVGYALSSSPLSSPDNGVIRRR